MALLVPMLWSVCPIEEPDEVKSLFRSWRESLQFLGELILPP